MLSIYWNIPQNDTRKLLRPVYEKIDLEGLANKFRFHPLGPPPSICQHALLPADFWDMWMAHSIKHVALQVTFQTAPQASSITFTSTSQLAEQGIFDVHVRVQSAEESLLELLTLTLKFYRGMKNTTVLRDIWCFGVFLLMCWSIAQSSSKRWPMLLFVLGNLQRRKHLRLLRRPTLSTTMKSATARVSRFSPLFCCCTWVNTQPFISRHTNKLLQQCSLSHYCLHFCCPSG